jgi:sialic acid synthase SpsE
MRTKLCAELGTAHKGDIGVALQMIQAAAEAGCNAVKIQHYGAVNPADPQAEWLNQSRLHVDAIESLRVEVQTRGMEFWATPFDEDRLAELVELDVDRIKIASTEAHNQWWRETERCVVSWPWGKTEAGDWPEQWTHLTAIPLYPTPLECIGKATMLQGWSDHVVGLSACYRSIAQHARWIEAHLKLPGVTTRDRDWEKTPADFRLLRQFAEDVATMRSGVSQMFRDRWSKS